MAFEIGIPVLGQRIAALWNLDMSTVAVRITGKFRVPSASLFDAWLSPSLIGEWMFGPLVRADESVIRITIDPRVGGAFSFLVRRAGKEIDHFGEYRVVDRPHHLEFTWCVSGVVESSNVIVKISPRGKGCELTLLHALHPNWTSHAEKVAKEWGKMIEVLGQVIGSSPTQFVDESW